MADTYNDLLFSGVVGGNLAGTIQSDWVKLANNVREIAIECMWNGVVPNGVLSLQSKVTGFRTLVQASVVTNSPDGTTYTGNLDAADPDLADLGEALVTAALVQGDNVRLVYTRVGGTGEIRARMVYKV
jgi:hypothetical protein